MEAGGVPSRHWPTTVRAYAEGDKSSSERVDAALEQIRETVGSMSLTALREMAGLCDVPEAV